MKTDGELRKNKDQGFIQTLVSGEMDSNFAVENALLVGMAPFTVHGDPRWNYGAVGSPPNASAGTSQRRNCFVG